MNSSRLGKTLLLFTITLNMLRCTDNPVGSRMDSYTGEFELISIEPPLNSGLNACDTIRAVFYYKLPPRITDNDTVFDFYLSFYDDTTMSFDDFEYRPKKTVFGYDVKTLKQQDTLSIKCPVSKIIKLDVGIQPLEFRFAMKGEKECSEGLQAGAGCWDIIEYREIYQYESVDTSACR